jgi:ABC-2 type transport system permease protein
MRLAPLPGDVGLVAGRELRTRVRSRIFRTGTLLVLIVVSAAVVVPTLLGSKTSIQRVGFTGSLTAQARAAVIADGAAAGTSVKLVTAPPSCGPGGCRCVTCSPADGPLAGGGSRGNGFPQGVWTTVCATPASLW